MRGPISLLIVSMAVMLFSCTQPRYIYNAPSRNLHYFTDRGQSKISADWATGGSRQDSASPKAFNHGLDIQGAYAIGRKWALMASYYDRRERDLIRYTGWRTMPLTTEVNYKRSGFDIGGSFFTPINRYREFIHLDGGIGWINNSFTDRGSFDSLGTTRNYSNKSFRFYLQPGLYTGEGAVQVGLGVRLQWQFFSDIKTNYTTPELVAYELNGLNNIMNWEPYVSLRYGPPSIPWLKAEIQGCAVTTDKGYYVRGGYFSFGLVVQPGVKIVR